MPRTAVKDNKRLSLRIGTRDKAMIMRASALLETDMSDFVIRHAIKAAEDVIERAEHVTLSARDGQRVLDLLENPPTPNERLLAAARAMPAVE